MGVDDQDDARTSSYKGNCRNKCGVEDLTTCSCDVKCKIRHDCCKDLQLSCPKLYNESNTRFQKLIQLLQECDYSNYLLVSGCPQDQSMLKEVDADIVARLETISEGHGAVNRLFSQVPVTDLDSEFSFKNISVYLCNAMLGRNLQFWNVRMETFELGPNGVLTYEELSRVQSAIYPPTQLQKYSSLFQCDFDDTDNLLISSRSQLNKKVSPELKNFESFCTLCLKLTNTSNNGNHSTKNERPEDTFPIVASFENDQFIFQVDASFGERENIPWSYIQCSNLETKKDEISENDSSCSIISCSKQFDQTEDGQCKIIYILQLAVPDDNFQMTTSFLDRLSSYFECYLKKYSGFDVEDKWHVSEQFFDKTLQRTFYVTQVLMYSRNVIDIFNRVKDAERYYLQFSEAIQVLRMYRSKLNLKPHSTSKEALPIRTFDFTLKNIKSNLLIGDTLNAIPVCADFVSKSYLNFPILHSLLLQCTYIPETNVTIGEMNTENNTCLGVFTFSAQHAGTHTFSTVLLVSILLICLRNNCTYELC